MFNAADNGVLWVGGCEVKEKGKYMVKKIVIDLEGLSCQKSPDFATWY